MSKEIKVSLKDQPLHEQPSDSAIQEALHGHKVVSILGCVRDADGWSVRAEVEASKPKPKPKAVAKSKAEAKPKKSLIGSDSD